MSLPLQCPQLKQRQPIASSHTWSIPYSRDNKFAQAFALFETLSNIGFSINSLAEGRRTGSWSTMTWWHYKTIRWNKQSSSYPTSVRDYNQSSQHGPAKDESKEINRCFSNLLYPVYGFKFVWNICDRITIVKLILNPVSLHTF